jgi:hypothetical protein
VTNARREMSIGAGIIILRVTILVLFGVLAQAPAQPAASAQPTPPGQLTVDASFSPAFDAPDFKPGEKPIVLIDEAHRNVISLHTYLGPVGRWFEKLGYLVRPARGKADDILQATADRTVLVIANAQAPDGSPADASAFTEHEVIAIDGWIRDGGALLLVADRAPFGAPVRPLAKALGVTVDNNTILRTGADGKPTGELTIDVNQHGERLHPIFDRVLTVVYIVGESVDGPGVMLRAPDGVYSGPTAQAAEGPTAAGKPLILAFEHGKGRVVVIGDGGVVSAFGSADGNARRGISEGDNARLVRNVLKWLTRR